MRLKPAHLLSALPLFLFSTTSEARFVHTDAAFIDSEEQRDKESFNDLASYMTPLYWSNVWEKSKNGYRMNTGSLDGYKSIYDEEIKLEDGNDSFRLAYNQWRYEDKVVLDIENELDFIFSPTKYFEYWFMASAMADKKWSDLGVAFRFLESDKYDLLFKGWVVDAFYKTKETNPEDTYKEYIYTFETELSLNLPADLAIDLDITYDSPVTWIRESEQYTYEYQKQILDLEVTYGFSDLWDVVLYGYLENKIEGKIWTNNPDHEYSKKNDKDFYRASLVAEYLEKRDSLRYGLEYIHIDQKNENKGYTGNSSHTYFEKAGESGQRTEWMAFVEYSMPTWDIANFQLGYYISSVESSFFEPNHSVQQKLQALFDFRPTDSTAVALNLTYDIDKIIKNIAESDKEISLYGGGNIQAMIYL